MTWRADPLRPWKIVGAVLAVAVPAIWVVETHGLPEAAELVLAAVQAPDAPRSEVARELLIIGNSLVERMIRDPEALEAALEARVGAPVHVRLAVANRFVLGDEVTDRLLVQLAGRRWTVVVEASATRDLPAEAERGPLRAVADRTRKRLSHWLRGRGASPSIRQTNDAFEALRADPRLESALAFWNERVLDEESPASRSARRLLEGLRRAGVRVAVLQAPHSRSLETTVPTLVARQRALVDRLAGPLPLLRLDEPLDDACFIDHRHVNRVGREQLRPWLVERLAALLNGS